jgi:hypothetical protein
MLGMATGVRLHPAVRVLIGAAMIAAGLALHRGIALVVLGVVLALYGIAGALGLTGDDAAPEPDGAGQSRVPRP